MYDRPRSQLSDRLPRGQCIILSTHDAVLYLVERMSTLTSVEYNDGEIGSVLINALRQQRDVEAQIQSFVEHFASRHDKDEYGVVTEALTNLAHRVQYLINRLGLRSSDGSLDYFFGEWLNYDLVLCKLPY